MTVLSIVICKVAKKNNILSNDTVQAELEKHMTKKKNTNQKLN